MGGAPTERQIIDTYQKLNQELQMLAAKLNDLDIKAQEHQLVHNALEPLDKNRKCFRLVGGVLVERTVSEVLPVLNMNGSQLAQVRARRVLRQGLACGAGLAGRLPSERCNSCALPAWLLGLWHTTKRTACGDARVQLHAFPAALTSRAPRALILPDWDCR